MHDARLEEEKYFILSKTWEINSNNKNNLNTVYN